MGRNHLLIGAGALAVVLLLGIAGMVLTGDDDEAEQDTTPLATTPRLGKRIGYGTISATIRAPRRWVQRRSGHTLVLRSPDRTVLLSVSLPTGTDRSAAVLKTAVSALRRQYRGVRVIGADQRRVADLPATSVITSGANARGVSLRILTAAVQGRTRAWLIQVFSAAGARERRLAEAQLAIGTLRLTG